MKAWLLFPFYRQGAEAKSLSNCMKITWLKQGFGSEDSLLIPVLVP